MTTKSLPFYVESSVPMQTNRSVVPKPTCSRHTCKLIRMPHVGNRYRPVDMFRVYVGKHLRPHRARAKQIRGIPIAVAKPMDRQDVGHLRHSRARWQPPRTCTTCPQWSSGPSDRSGRSGPSETQSVLGGNTRNRMSFKDNGEKRRRYVQTIGTSPEMRRSLHHRSRLPRKPRSRRRTRHRRRGIRHHH